MHEAPRFGWRGFINDDFDQFAASPAWVAPCASSFERL